LAASASAFSFARFSRTPTSLASDLAFRSVLYASVDLGMSLFLISLKPAAMGSETPKTSRTLWVVSALCWSLGVSAFLGLFDFLGKRIRRAL